MNAPSMPGSRPVAWGTGNNRSVTDAAEGAVTDEGMTMNKRATRNATLLLALWLPLRQTWLDSQNDEAIRITRTQRSGQQRRTRARGQRNRRDNHITLDPDTGQLIWPETQEDRLWT
jgi:apolipoprotein N-acyltransferase